MHSLITGEVIGDIVARLTRILLPPISSVSHARLTVSDLAASGLSAFAYLSKCKSIL